MKISIAMATYNGAKYLRDQLESFKNQTRRPDELIICDDCSSDESIQIIENFRKEAPFSVNIHRNKINLGCTKSFSNAIDNCSGDLILLSDQDDIWLQQKINRLEAVFQTNPKIGYAFSDALLVNEHLSLVGTLWARIKFSNHRQQRYLNGEQLETMLAGGFFVYGNTLAFRATYRDLILPIESISKGITHDTWIAILLSAVGIEGMAIKDPLVLYRQHPRQIVGAGGKTNLKSMLWAVKRGKVDQTLKSKDLLLLKDRAKSAPHESLALIFDYAKHLECRASLSGLPFPKKTKIIFLEYKSGRYSRFSNSVKSVFRDLIFA